MSQVARFSALVERIYEAALEPKLWAGIPQPVAELHSSPQSMLFAVRLPGVDEGFMYPYGVKQSSMEIWEAGAGEEDIWVANGVRKGLFRAGKVVRGEDLVPDEEFLASDYYRRFLKPQDSRYLLSGVVFDGTEGSPTSVCSVIRGHGDKTFAPSNVELHQLITNHLSRAMGTMWRLRARDMEVASTHAALDRLGTAVVLINARGGVAFANARARALLQRGDGLSMRASASGDSLCLPKGDDQRRLDCLLAEAVASDRAIHAEHFSRAIRVSRPSGLLDYVLQAAPLAQSNGFGPPSEHRAVVFVSDPSDSARLDAAILRTTYALTPAEVRLADELLSGDSLPDIAARLAVSESTVRTQLRSIFDKTGTRRQAQLMKLLMSMRA